MSNHLSLTSFLSKCILGFLATLLMGTAISLFLACNLGSDPITVFLDGFHKKTGVSVGVTDQFLNLILLVIGFVFNRKAIGIQSAMTIILNAGDARVACKKALDAIAKSNFESAKTYMK